MKKLITIILAAIILSGCDNSDAYIASGIRNKQRIDTGGEVIGNLPDGREIKRIVLEVPGLRNQFIYIVDNATTVTVNKETGGKHSVNEVSATIILNGETYRKIEAEKK